MDQKGINAGQIPLNIPEVNAPYSCQLDCKPQSTSKTVSFRTNSSNICIRALQTIPNRSNVLMLSATQSFTNRQFMGASQRQSNSIKSAFLKAREDYELFESEEIQSLFRIILQVYANSMEMDNDSMPLYNFANCLLMEEDSSPFKLQQYAQCIKSPHLLNILKANNHMVSKLYTMLTSFVKTTNQKQFQQNLKVIRSQIRKLSHHPQQKQDFIDFISPIFPHLSLSYNSNCRVQGKYFTHLRQSYYCLETNKQVKKGEELTLPHRYGLNNYDKFVRYGSKSICENNPYSCYLLLIRLQSEPQVLGGDISKKTALLKSKNLKMKNVVRIGINGSILDEDLQMLRILFEAQNEQKDKQIYHMIKKYVEQHLQMLKKIKGQKSGQKKDDENLRGIRLIEKEQEDILNNFIHTNK